MRLTDCNWFLRNVLLLHAEHSSFFFPMRNVLLSYQHLHCNSMPHTLPHSHTSQAIARKKFCYHLKTTYTHIRTGSQNFSNSFTIPFYTIMNKERSCNIFSLHFLISPNTSFSSSFLLVYFFLLFSYFFFVFFSLRRNGQKRVQKNTFKK